MSTPKYNTLRLYITGITIENQEAIIVLKNSLQQELGSDYKLEVIDIFKNPELAEGDKIVATPTVVSEMSGNVKKVIMDFSSKERILMGLDILFKTE